MAAPELRAQLPVDKDSVQLRILNSFTKETEPFITGSDMNVKWYSCGPTVYDVSHLGHARCYITFDIIRRIMANYFGYKVFYVMNITDIDDKIIKRARGSYLSDQFFQNFLQGATTATDFLAQLANIVASFKTKFDVANGNCVSDDDNAKVDMLRQTLESSEIAFAELKTLIVSSDQNKDKISDCFERLRDVVADYQDERFGSSVTDHRIFKSLTTKFEEEFHEDMRRLNVMPADITPRVSEYIQETGEYIRVLEQNGFAYRVDGSVYFDTEKFDSDPKHRYAKLVREAYGHKKSLDEGEGDLLHQVTKKSPHDFALWKKSKPGEPNWKVLDYEPGRPGWHIECSVMASQLLGDRLDIHSGGCDLKFPHHDNEIAQAEAYYNSGKNWVNYFIHSGHLSISGCKMSKSLKNFITIRQALEKHTARQLRFAFLAHKWTGGLDYSENTMREAIHYEKKFKEFFMNSAYTFWERGDHGENSNDDNAQNRTSDDHQLHQEYLNAIKHIDKSLCDNFDTNSVLKILSALVKECNKRPDTETSLLREITDYVDKLLRIFGTNFDDMRLDNIEIVFKYVKALAEFRAKVRKASKEREILELCDLVRDQTLPNLGVTLEDRPGDGLQYRVRFIDADTLAEEQAQQERERLIKEEKAKSEKLRVQQQREEKMKINPQEMFKCQTDKYSKFDDNGIPTHDAKGEEISKSALKKLQRVFNEQKEKYERYLSIKRAE